MKKTIESIRKQRVANEAKIKALRDINDNLLIEEYKLSNYTETMEKVRVGRKSELRLRGRIHWNEDFIDEDTGEVITISRNQIVMEDNIWRI